MANLEVVETPAPAEVTPAAAKPKKIVPLAILAGSLVLGVALGAVVIAPRFASHPAGTASAPAGTASAPAAAKKHSGEPGPVIEIDNVVVNPAGAEGSHYVMATVAIEVHDKKVEEHLRLSEHVVKDIVMSTMSRETMDMLRRPGARDVIKASLGKAIEDFTGQPGSVTVYLPEFVVQ